MTEMTTCSLVGKSDLYGSSDAELIESYKLQLTDWLTN